MKKAKEMEIRRKQFIMNVLRDVIAATDAGHDLVALKYDDRHEVVMAEFRSGGKRVINVAMDSEWTMIKDVVNHIDIG